MAKQTADIVLANDSLNSIVAGVEEGRGVFEKIQNIVFFFVAVSLGEALVLFASSFIVGFFLMHTWQLIYLAAVQFVAPFALVIDKLSQKLMSEKPKTDENLIGQKRRINFIVFTLALSIALSIAYILAFNGTLPIFAVNKTGFIPGLQSNDPLASVSWEQAKARTMFVSVAVISTSILVLSLRRMNKSIFNSLRQDMNIKIFPFILSVPLIHLIIMYVPAIQNLLSNIGISFEIVSLAPVDWLVVLMLGFLPIIMLEITKLALKRRKLPEQ